MRFGLFDVSVDQLEGLGDRQSGLREGLHDGHRPAAQLAVTADVVDQPLAAFDRLVESQTQLAGPATEARGGEQVSLLVVGQAVQGVAEQPADDVFAHVVERADAALFAAAQKRVDDLEQQVFEKVGVLLVYAGRDQQLPGSFAAKLKPRSWRSSFTIAGLPNQHPTACLTTPHCLPNIPLPA